jgi:NarL family two-component system sensor histidine kinase LiaS
MMGGWPFRRLGWKLTLSYTLVTVATLLVVEAVVLGLTWFLTYSSSLIPQQVSTILEAYAAPDLQPLLSGEPDREALQAWLERFYSEGVEVTPGQRLLVSAYAGASGSEAAILDAEGRLLASLPAGVGTPGELFVPESAGRVPEVLTDALAGEERATGYQRVGENRYVMAVPVRDEPGRVVGVLYYSSVFSALSSQEFLSTMARTFVLPSVVLITVAAALLGTFFGFLTARGLTRRLRRLSEAAAAWGRGDLDARVEDRSGDEVGQLARVLSQMAAEIERLLATGQQLAALEERNRLARDLHDSVKQQIFAASMTLGTADALWERDPGAARAQVGAVRGLLQGAQAELRSLIHELRPAALEGRGLVAALEGYAADWAHHSGIAAVVRAENEQEAPLAVEEALFRVAQEALANVQRHSGATQVEVTLAWAGQGVTLRVTDDGHGFDPEAAWGRGLGLPGMRERVEALGGRLEVSSAPGQPTTIAARMPLD